MGALMAPAWINFSEPAQALEVRAPRGKKKKKLARDTLGLESAPSLRAPG